VIHNHQQANLLRHIFIITHKPNSQLTSPSASLKFLQQPDLSLKTRSAIILQAYKRQAGNILRVITELPRQHQLSRHPPPPWWNILIQSGVPS